MELIKMSEKIIMRFPENVKIFSEDDLFINEIINLIDKSFTHILDNPQYFDILKQNQMNRQTIKYVESLSYLVGDEKRWIFILLELQLSTIQELFEDIAMDDELKYNMQIILQNLKQCNIKDQGGLVQQYNQYSQNNQIEQIQQVCIEDFQQEIENIMHRLSRKDTFHSTEINNLNNDPQILLPDIQYSEHGNYQDFSEFIKTKIQNDNQIYYIKKDSSINLHQQDVIEKLEEYLEQQKILYELEENLDQQIFLNSVEEYLDQNVLLKDLDDYLEEQNLLIDLDQYMDEMQSRQSSSIDLDVNFGRQGILKKGILQKSFQNSRTSHVENQNQEQDNQNNQEYHDSKQLKSNNIQEFQDCQSQEIKENKILDNQNIKECIQQEIENEINEILKKYSQQHKQNNYSQNIVQLNEFIESENIYDSIKYEIEIKINELLKQKNENEQQQNDGLQNMIHLDQLTENNNIKECIKYEVEKKINEIICIQNEKKQQKQIYDNIIKQIQDNFVKNQQLQDNEDQIQKQQDKFEQQLQICDDVDEEQQQIQDKIVKQQQIYDDVDNQQQQIQDNIKQYQQQMYDKSQIELQKQFQQIVSNDEILQQLDIQVQNNLEYYIDNIDVKKNVDELHTFQNQDLIINENDSSYRRKTGDFLQYTQNQHMIIQTNQNQANILKQTQQFEQAYPTKFSFGKYDEQKTNLNQNIQEIDFIDEEKSNQNRFSFVNSTSIQSTPTQTKSVFDSISLQNSASTDEARLMKQNRQKASQILFENKFKETLQHYKLNDEPQSHMRSSNKDKCRQCKKTLYIQFFISNMHYCEYMGYWYCSDCISLEKKPLPWNIVKNFDLTKYQISKEALKIYDKMKIYPLIEFQYTDGLLKDNEVYKIMVMKRKLNIMYDMLCDPFIAEEIFQNQQNFLLKSNYFTLNDFYQIKNGLLFSKIEQLYKKLESHIYLCEKCKIRSRQCKICKLERIYVFWLESTRTCKQCNTLYHKYCLQTNKCPQCYK